MLNETTPIEMFYKWEKERAFEVYLKQPVSGVWIDYTWMRVAKEARSMATALKKMGVEKGDKVAICSKNCAHWVMADLAIMLAEAVSVPLYPHQQPETTRYVLEHSESKVVFVGKLDDPDLIAAGIPDSVATVGFPYAGSIKPNHHWDELVEANSPLKENPVPRLNDIFTIIYTSGTTGLPKGVVHNYRAASFACGVSVTEFDMTTRDKVVSFLPMSHVAERFMVELASIYAGGLVAFVESLDTFTKNIQEIQPTMFFAVPRLWVKFQMGILEKLPEKKMERLLKIPVISGLIKKKIRKGLGLGEARYIISGAAPLAVPVLKWFAKLGIHIQEGYGLTENFAYGTLNRGDDIQVGSVGKSLSGGEVKVSPVGEILFRSPCVMQGYYKEPEKTKETLTDDGFLKTGDRGEFTADGHLKITGRVKEIFKTAKGKYVAPAPIEGLLLENTHIEQLCVMGTGLPAPVGLLVLSEMARTIDRSTLSRQISGTLEKVNQRLDPHEKMSQLIVVKDSWTVEEGLMTPTMKIKRHLVEKRYESLVATSVTRSESIYWEN